MVGILFPYFVCVYIFECVDSTVNAAFECYLMQCPFRENFSRTLLAGIKLEVINTDTEITDYPVYWMASVIDVAGL